MNEINDAKEVKQVDTVWERGNTPQKLSFRRTDELDDILRDFPDENTKPSLFPALKEVIRERIEQYARGEYERGRREALEQTKPYLVGRPT